MSKINDKNITKDLFHLFSVIPFIISAVFLTPNIFCDCFVDIKLIKEDFM